MKIKPTSTKKPKASEYNIPDGLVMVIDTREQTPLYMPHPPKGLVIVRDTLNSGDYSIRGFECQVAVERKSLEDFLGSIGTGRDRFKRELERLRGYDWAALVIEAPEDRVMSGGVWSAMKPESIRGTIVSICVRYRIPIYFAKDRVAAGDWVLRHLCKYYTLKRDGEL